MLGFDETPPGQWMTGLNAKTLDEARAEALRKLDYHDLTRTTANIGLSIKHAIIYEFKENVVGLYEKDKGKRQGEILLKQKQAELKKAEADVARLRQELGEG
jgi:hypothetical protein